MLIRLVVGLAVVALLAVGGAYLFWGEEGAEKVKDVFKGRLTRVEKRLEIPAHALGSFTFWCPPGGVLELRLTVSEGGEANVRLMEADAFERVRKAGGDPFSSSMEDVKAFRSDDVAGERVLVGEVGSGTWALLLQNDNLLNGIEVDIGVVKDFTQ